MTIDNCTEFPNYSSRLGKESIENCLIIGEVGYIMKKRGIRMKKYSI